jgi:hypothetical protein
VNDDVEFAVQPSLPLFLRLGVETFEDAKELL